MIIMADSRRETKSLYGRTICRGIARSGEGGRIRPVPNGGRRLPAGAPARLQRTSMTMPEAADAAPLNETLLKPAVADRRPDAVVSGDSRSPELDAVLLDRLRDIYAQQGIAAGDRVLERSLAALAEGRLGYTPPHGPAAALARLYVSRDRWGPPAFAVLVALFLGLGAFFFGYQPYRASQAQQAQFELTQSLPAEMDTLYESIFNETKVQTAAADADELRNRGKDAAASGAARPPAADLPAGGRRPRWRQARLLDVSAEQFGSDEFLRGGRGSRQRRQDAVAAGHQ
jgi:hypothetical protein